ncbi:MAG: hypothetical protein Dbin4_02690, partial [Alphaproteobacteria bacterium]|nr:hypothetical protein [Alphaproteobacteria bacterium]
SGRSRSSRIIVPLTNGVTGVKPVIPARPATGTPPYARYADSRCFPPALIARVRLISPAVFLSNLP